MPTPLYFVIYSLHEAATDPETPAGYWSNDLGWTLREGATLFTFTEMLAYKLPMSFENDAVWRLA